MGGSVDQGSAIMLTLLLILPALSGAVPRPHCRLIDNNPFFKNPARSAHVDQEMVLLTEFARFAQSQVPYLLVEFARKKRAGAPDAVQILRSIQARRGKARLLGEGRNTVTTTEAVTVTTITTEPATTDPVTTEAATTEAATTEAATTEAATTEAATTEAATTEAATTEPSTEEAMTEPATTEAMGDEDDDEDDDDDDDDDDEDEDDEDVDIQEAIESAIDNIVDAVTETFERFKEEPLSIKSIQAIGGGVINGLKNILEEIGLEIPDELPKPGLPDIDLPDVNLPDVDLPDISLPTIPELGEFQLSDWPWVCKVVWWPHEDEHCSSMRCAACSPAMLAAARVCQRRDGHVEHYCLRSVLGEGVCNYCAVDYLEY